LHRAADQRRLGRLAFDLVHLVFKLNSAVDLGLTKNLGKPEREQSSDNANEHPSDEKISHHRHLLSSLVAGEGE
jgi:hypothetical protein